MMEFAAASGRPERPEEPGEPCAPITFGLVLVPLLMIGKGSHP